MAQSQLYLDYPLICIPLWIEPAIRHEQLHFFVDDRGRPRGYVTWAWLAEDTEHRLIHDPNVLLHISEWNEGDRLWIIDFVILDSDVKKRVRETRELFAHFGLAKSLRRRRDGTVKKVTTWRKR